MYEKMASCVQRPPTRGNAVVYEAVLNDIKERVAFGKNKYGCYLQTNNGRNPLLDAYQEALDLVMYLRQALLEQEQEQKNEENNDFCANDKVSVISNLHSHFSRVGFVEHVLEDYLFVRFSPEEAILIDKSYVRRLAG